MKLVLEQSDIMAAIKDAVSLGFDGKSIKEEQLTVVLSGEPLDLDEIELTVEVKI